MTTSRSLERRGAFTLACIMALLVIARGMDDIEIANNLVGDGNPMLHAAGPPANGGLGFLAAAVCSATN
jgi:hypothetical protein